MSTSETTKAAPTIAPFATLLPGDPAPWFHQRSTSSPRYSFNTAAGRYIVLCFFGSTSDLAARTALEAMKANRAWFDDERASFFGVSIDPADEAQGRVRGDLPGIRFFWDVDQTVSRLYGAAPVVPPSQKGQTPFRRFWVVLDPTLRVLRIFALQEHEALFRYLGTLPPPDRFVGFELQAPILVLPDVFEPGFCQRLIGLYETNGGEESGFMREVDGKTVRMQDQSFKVRKDYTITDPDLVKETQARILRRVVPEILKAHQFKATRMERYIVSCYAAEDGAHFGAHRDNTTAGTAHRKFAVSINLNSDFEGGEVSFPEYGRRSYKAPPGGAVVFSCSLLHAVSRVTSGQRYAFLPFLYDDEAAKLRERNNAHLGEGVGAYRAE